ncbi:hypothetical protein [Microtetraspora fusca]|uniref:hypothetical protein n=1 Tax=Microtetraspora fusca TaxID=1997 RepID=UPI001C3F4B4D|nr:hypothetical protein [Microtetraspora fusca]
MTQPADLDVLIPTKDRPASLAVTLSGLAAQTVTGFRVVISDQSGVPVAEDALVLSVDEVVEQVQDLLGA